MQAQTLQFLLGLFPMDTFVLNVVDASTTGGNGNINTDSDGQFTANQDGKHHQAAKIFNKNTINKSGTKSSVSIGKTEQGQKPQFYDTPPKYQYQSWAKYCRGSQGPLVSQSQKVCVFESELNGTWGNMNTLGFSNNRPFKNKSGFTLSHSLAGTGSSTVSSASIPVPLPAKLTSSPTLEELARFSSQYHGNSAKHLCYEFRMQALQGEKPLYRSRRASSKLQRALNLSSESKEGTYIRSKLAKSRNQRYLMVSDNNFEHLSASIIRELKRTSNHGIGMHHHKQSGNLIVSPSSSLANSTININLSQDFKMSKRSLLRNSNVNSDHQAQEVEENLNDEQANKKPLLEQARTFARRLSNKENSAAARNCPNDYKEKSRNNSVDKQNRKTSSKTFSSILFETKGINNVSPPRRRAFQIVRRERLK
mmetsp:Transcript_18167/g.23189  ORF Transcript_18167/g.23189 Transcript_18167/m.23189 type:complete len:423 (-) Transcript_18167:97-1365(-)|eukprot:CAMPEP_0204837564 /NCGR_PEP_ID=MMETSP1346-20131115/28267_1 /ASSEMBLY_ACC=CAM_ASM_000771 /TAXON_ID=215587 /ORGANISM="Aplanochytrium stocchinoi, Strain GSBS06" /LENGTH=422 /DNA_ID=CAMNT_0051973075 /DNA_START=787 /DNA_END=2055 /DNA_ORIENTATION=+